MSWIFLAKLKLYYEALLASLSCTVRFFIEQNTKSLIYPLRSITGFFFEPIIVFLSTYLYPERQEGFHTILLPGLRFIKIKEEKYPLKLRTR